jgi:hypothetical protein
MKYFIDYQYMPKGVARPLDDGQAVGIEANDNAGVVILPNIGDHVHIDSVEKGDIRFSGKVRSRLFSYIRDGQSNINCTVNIVVEENDDDWGKLIKE